MKLKTNRLWNSTVIYILHSGALVMEIQITFSNMSGILS